MKTAHVLEELPLWVGGDLAEREAAAVRAHLGHCSVCFKAAEALRESRAWIQEADAPPFTFEERRRLRLDVMARLQADPPRKGRGAMPFPGLRPLLLGAAALGLFLAVKGLPRSPSDRRNQVAVQALPQFQPARSGPVPASSAAPIPHPRTARARAPVKPAEDSAPSEAPLSRIEFQTSNPQIRIIWLARAEGAQAEPHPSPDHATDPL